MLDYVAQYEKNIAILKGPDPLDALNIPKGHDFNVVTIPASDIIKEGYNVSKKAVGIVREGGIWNDELGRYQEHVFDFASTLFKPLNRSKIVGVMKHAIRESGIDTSNMNVSHRFTKDSGRWSCYVKFPQVTIEPAIGDITQYGLQISDSYDLTNAFMQMAMAMRLWCLNGMCSRETTYSTRRKHTTNISLEGEATKMKNGIDAFFDSEVLYKEWMRKSVSHADAEWVFTNTLAEYHVSGIRKVKQKILEELLLDFQRTSGDNLWTLYNVATAWSSHPPHRKKGWEPDRIKRRQIKVSSMLRSNYWSEIEGTVNA